MLVFSYNLICFRSCIVSNGEICWLHVKICNWWVLFFFCCAIEELKLIMAQRHELFKLQSGIYHILDVVVVHRCEQFNKPCLTP